MRISIVSAALDLCSSQGLQGGTIVQIAAEADVAPRTVGRHFPTKEDIILDPFTYLLTDSIHSFRAQSPIHDEMAALFTSFRYAIGRIVDREGPYSFEQYQQMERLIQQSPRLRVHRAEAIRVYADNLAAILTATGDCSERTSKATLAIWQTIMSTALDEWSDKIVQINLDDAAALAMRCAGDAFDTYLAVFAKTLASDVVAEIRRFDA